MNSVVSSALTGLTLSDLSATTPTADSFSSVSLLTQKGSAGSGLLVRSELL